jgi:hypothetical protein
MAAYELAHKQGRNLDVDLRVQVTKASFAHGDCFAEPSRCHGTPMQGECAALWGAQGAWI